MKYNLLYGKNGLSINLSDEIKITVINKHQMQPLENPVRSLRDAFRNSVGCPALGEVAQGKRDACILICDITRPVPNGIVLPELVKTLIDSGIPRDNITILVATGLHRPNEGEELREVIGSNDIFNTIRIENHFARDRDVHVHLGKTSNGTPIYIDRRFVEADLKIITGLVEPHFMAGYSGGRKVVAPGVAYQDTILQFHHARVLEHSHAANCVIKGNPLHDDQIEIVRAIGGIFAVNFVIDENRDIGFVNFGEIEESHEQAVDFMRSYAEVFFPRRFNTVVTTSAGYPLDKTYYQTIKGMVGVMDIVEKNGTIIIASECSEGLGSPEFVESQRLLCELGSENFMSTIKKRDLARIDEWETEMLLKPLRTARIKLFSTGLSMEDREYTFVETISSIEDAVRQSVKESGDAEVAIVPEGPYVIPRYAL